MKSKNIIIILILLLSLILPAFADEVQTNYKVSGFDVFLKQNINKEISVSISNLDITITGILIAVYDDSIIVRSFSKDVLIAKAYIAYVKSKSEDEK